MKRLDFVRLCTLASLAGGGAVASAFSASVPAPRDLVSLLKAAGLRSLSIRESDAEVRVRGRVSDFNLLSREAARLGEGKVSAKGNVLSFTRDGRQVTLELLA